MFHVSKQYQQVPAAQAKAALNDINLNIEKGGFVFLTGPSGAGKTTLLKLIFCDETPSSGQVIIDGRNIARIKQYQIPYLRRQIGVVFQDFKLIHAMTVAENVALALEVTGVYGARARKKVNTMVHAVGLGHKLNAYPLQLSAGEQQRVAISRALINDPKILLADEPTGNLDENLTNEILELLKIINARGTTVVVATHNEKMVRAANKTVLRLQDGCLMGAA